jgi:hypothetical protein
MKCYKRIYQYCRWCWNVWGLIFRNSKFHCSNGEDIYIYAIHKYASHSKHWALYRLECIWIAVGHGISPLYTCFVGLVLQPKILIMMLMQRKHMIVHLGASKIKSLFIYKNFSSYPTGNTLHLRFILFKERISL